jgi:hypothetical protein
MASPGTQQSSAQSAGAQEIVKLARRVLAGICLGIALFCSNLGVAAGKVAELQAHFDHENDPVHRAKLMVKLGEAQFEETRRAFKADDLVTVGIVLEKYRDNVRLAVDGLKKRHVDAQRDSNGFRQLEIHIQHGIREVEEVILRVPEQYQPPLQLVRSDLDAMDREMLNLLFRHPEPLPGAAKPPESEVKK